MMTDLGHIKSCDLTQPNPSVARTYKSRTFRAKSAISAKWREVAQKAEVISRQDCGELDGAALLALPRITSAHRPEISPFSSLISVRNPPE